MPMPKVARKVAIPRSVPSAGALISGTLLQLSVESLNLARKAPPLPGQRRLPLGLADQAGAGDSRRVVGGDRVGMTRVRRVVAGDEEGRNREALELGDAPERSRSRHLAQRRDQRVEMAMAFHPFACEAQDRVAPA